MDGQASSLCCHFVVNGILNGEIGRTLIVYFCVASHAVIKDFNLFKNDTVGLLSGVETIMRQTFSFKRAKETFQRRIMRALHCVQMPANFALRALHCVQMPANSEFPTITFTAHRDA